MREMRRSDRMITDREEIVDVLDSCKVFRMAVARGGGHRPWARKP